MDYLITFEDGSSGYLSHHGVQGMKWGVRNEETLRKYQHSRGAQRARAKMEKTSNQLSSAVRSGDEKTAKRYSRALASQQISYHAKEAKKGGEDALKGPGGSIRKDAKTADDALNTAADILSWGTVIGGPIGAGIAGGTKSYKDNMKIYTDMVDKYANQNLDAARKYVESGSDFVDAALKAKNKNYHL